MCYSAFPQQHSSGSFQFSQKSFPKFPSEFWKDNSAIVLSLALLIGRDVVQSHDDINCTYLKEPCIIKLVSSLIKSELLIGSRSQSLNLLTTVLCWIIYLKGNMLHCADIDCREELWRINRSNLLSIVSKSCRSWTGFKRFGLQFQAS